MPNVGDIAKLLNDDRGLKGGAQFNNESLRLTRLYQGQARKETRRALEQRGQGDRDNDDPFTSKILKRLINRLAVIWSSAPGRFLTLEGVDIGGEKAEAELLARVYRQANVNGWLKQADRYRALLGQSILYLSPNDRRERLRMRVFPPHLIARRPDKGDQDDMGADSEVAIMIADAEHEQDRVWDYWRQDEDGWRAWRTDGRGEVIGGDTNQLYEDGTPPFSVEPFIQIYDELPMGRAYQPIEESRASFAVGINVLLNEAAFLLKMEGHSPIAITGISAIEQLPDRWGPGHIWGFEDADVSVAPVTLNPKLAEAIGISRHFLEQLAISEGLPADFFLPNRQYESGAAGRLRQQDSEEKRTDLLEAAVDTEILLFQIVRDMHNGFSRDWREPTFDDALELTAEMARPYFPLDLDEMQKAYGFDLSIGAASILDYIQERHHMTRPQAIGYFGRVTADRETYPLIENANALTGGRNATLGEDSATPTRDAKDDPSSINPNRAASVEGASRVAAAKRGITRAS